MLEFNFIGGTRKYIKGKKLSELDQKTSGWGQVGFITNGETYPFGECHGMAFKNAMTDVVEIPDEAFEKKVAEEKEKERAAEEQRKKDREEQLARLKTNADYEAAVRERDALEVRCNRAEAVATLLLGRTFKGRIRRAWAWAKRGGRKAES